MPFFDSSGLDTPLAGGTLPPPPTGQFTNPVALALLQRARGLMTRPEDLVASQSLPSQAMSPRQIIGGVPDAPPLAAAQPDMSAYQRFLGPMSPPPTPQINP